MFWHTRCLHQKLETASAVREVQEMRRALPLNDQPNYSVAAEYATADDFQNHFASEMTDLFHLAFLLTADIKKAEHCIILSMHQSMERGQVFKAWLPVWIRNTVIQNGVAIVERFRGRSLGEASIPSIPETQQIGACDDLAAVVQLSDLDRLVWVICILERYTTSHCAKLLSRSVQEVRDARNRAIAEIGSFKKPCRVSNDSYSRTCLPSSDDRSDFDGSCGSLLN